MTAAPLGPALLFCPGDRPDRFENAFGASANVVLDLEDGVAPSRKDAARAAVADALRGEWASRAVVRLNPRAGGGQDDDLTALAGCTPRAWMVPKAEDPADLDLPGAAPIVALCETAKGVLRAADLAAEARCEALLWGSEDLARDLGGVQSRTPDGRYHPLMLQARHHVLLAARAAGKDAVDAVHLAIEDVDDLRAEVRDAARIGFAAKAAIHPLQVATIVEAFAPDPVDVAWAEGLLAAEQRRDPAQRGVFVFEGKMVDAPMMARARRVLERVAAADGMR